MLCSFDFKVKVKVLTSIVAQTQLYFPQACSEMESSGGLKVWIAFTLLSVAASDKFAKCDYTAANIVFHCVVLGQKTGNRTHHSRRSSVRNVVLMSRYVDPPQYQQHDVTAHFLRSKCVNHH